MNLEDIPEFKHFEKFIVFSEEDKEKISQMSEEQINAISCLLASELRKIPMKIQKDE